jgi:Secretion system C-terminal sorting domain
MKKIIIILVLGILMHSITKAQEIHKQATLWYKVQLDTSNLTINLYEKLDTLNEFVISNCLAAPVLLDSTNSFNINYNPALYLSNNGVNNFEVPYIIEGETNKTLLIVYQASDTVNESTVWEYRLNDEEEVGLTTKNLKTMYGEYLYIDSITGSIEDNAILNTITFTTDDALIDSVNGFVFGKTDSMGFEGNIAEFIYIENQLIEEDLHKWQTYLAVKYGMTIQEQNYIDSENNILWELDSTYNTAIIGIGMDTAFGLNQKQSRSSSFYDIVSIGLGEISASNLYNPSQFNQGQYIILANNNAPLSFQSDSLSGYSILDRKWKLKVNGANTNSLPTALKVDIKPLNYDTIGFPFLIINREATEDFNSIIPELIVPDSISSDSFAYFHNINWDIDSSGFDIFSFGIYSLSTRSQEANNANSPQSGTSAQNNFDFINDPSKITAYNLYPNPSYGGKFTLEVFSKIQTDFEITIFDINGKLIKSYIKKNQIHFSITDQLLTQGQYMLRVSSNEEVKTFALIVN